MTEIFTKVNAVNAPKLINEVEVAISNRSAKRPTTPTARIAGTGVLYASFNFAKRPTSFFYVTF